MKDAMNNIGKPMYGLINSGLPGASVVSGIVTGVRFTEDKPLYEISFGQNSWWTKEITDKVEEIGSLFKLAPLERVKETHGLKKNYGV